MKKTYEQLKKDPTASYKRKLVAILTRLKDEGKLGDKLYSRLYPTSEKIPQLYCLPKIHKKDVPFRPIVDYTSSIGYNTSRFLADILNPLIGQSELLLKIPSSWLRNCPASKWKKTNCSSLMT